MGSRRAAQVPGMRAPQPTVRGNQRIGGLIDAVLSHGRSEPITTTALDAVCCSVCARSSTDRASDYGSEGWGFESLRARHVSAGQGHLLECERWPCCLWGRISHNLSRDLDDVMDLGQRLTALLQVVVGRVNVGLHGERRVI